MYFWNTNGRCPECRPAPFSKCIHEKELTIYTKKLEAFVAFELKQHHQTIEFLEYILNQFLSQIKQNIILVLTKKVV